MTRIQPLETVERALEVLRALNLLGGATISGLARFTGMPRGAVNRYVVTFESLGYVYKVTDGKGYRVGPQALELSSGAKTDAWVWRDAVPEMTKLCSTIGWPIGLEGIRDTRLAILANTDSLSPFVARPLPQSMRLPLVGRASGHVQLAYMNEDLRRNVLAAALAADPDLFRRAGTTPKRLESELETVRANGFALQRVANVNWSVVAVPIKSPHGNRFSLSARFPTKVVGENTAMQSLVEKLTATAERIAEKFQHVESGI